MTLTIKYALPAPRPLGEWPLPIQPAFIHSHAYETLKRELSRYLRREVDGRSFLISGHRGVGKTALTLRAVADCRIDALTASITQDPAGPPLQRPLLVKLHGPSLLEAALAPTRPQPRPSPTVTQPPAPGPEPSPRVMTTAAPAAAAPSAGKTEDRPAAPTALSLITVALYRALAQEAAEAYRIHAREEQLRQGGDYLEIAGQLILDLDRGAAPGALRDFWARLRRLEQGVFWPRDARVGDLRRADHGVREVLALAAAGQAFRKSVGKEQDSETAKGAGSDEQTLDSAGGINLSDAVNKLVGLAAGAGVAGAMFSYQHGVTAEAVAAGLGTGMISALSLGWTRKRKLTREQGREYSFIPDTSMETLDRDLPLMIDRIRQAGLAPVFLVDELDKLAPGDSEVDPLSAFIDQLKQLTTDYGFFCFLTDRDYYEHVTSVIRDGAFPKQHTYFSARQFVVYGPNEFKTYLAGLLSSTADDGAPEAADDAFAKKVFPLILLHRSKLNTVDMMRELSRESGQGEGTLRQTSGQIAAHPANRFAATIQLAIDHIVRGEALAQRIEAEPMFAQVMFDALYRVSRVWESEAPSITCTREELVKYLAGRIRRSQVVNAATAEKVVQDVLGEVDLALVVEETERLEDYLRSFEALKRDLTASPPPEGEDVVRQVIPTELVDGLLSARQHGGATFDFTYDAYGRKLEDAKTAAARADDRRHANAVDAFAKLAGAANIDPELLSGLGLLPSSISWSEVVKASQIVAPSARASRAASGAARATLEAFYNVLRDQGQAVVSLLALARLATVEAGRPLGAGISPAVRAIGRFAYIRRLIESGGAPEFLARLTSAPEVDFAPPESDEELSLRVLRWTRFLQIAPTGPGNPSLLAESLRQRQARSFKRWRRLLQGWTPGEATFWGADFDDIVLATAERAPSAFLRADAPTVTLLEWSELALVCLAAGAPGDAADRAWIASKAFQTLGFGRQALSMILQAPAFSGLERDIEYSSAIDGQPDGLPGFALRVPPGFALANEPPVRAGVAIIAIPEERAKNYVDVTDWLIAQNVIGEVLEE